MHPNPIFHTETDARNLAFARARAFGVLATDGPLLAHVPFLLDQDGTQLGLHLVRSNPIARVLAKGKISAKIAIQGPHSYISPDWYDVPDQVPTWNYIAVHLSGTLELRPETELRALIDAQSKFFEEKFTDKTPWTSQKMTPDVLVRMMRQIVPCRMSVEAVAGTWKLNQNKPVDVRLRAADRVAQDGLGAELVELAEHMRDA